MCALQKQTLHRKIAKLYILYDIAIKNERKQGQFWVQPIFSTEKRLLQGTSDNLIKEMLAEDMEKYVDYFRMPSQIFKALLALVRPTITKQYFIRDFTWDSAPTYTALFSIRREYEIPVIYLQSWT